MLDLNHGSGCQYAPPSASAAIGIAINGAIDAWLTARNRSQPPRTYVSSSGLGRPCLRQIQYDYLAVPKDPGHDFAPKTLRIFEAGHRGEDVVAAWLRAAGFDLRTERRDGRQFGFSALGGRFKGHIDGCVVGGPAPMAYPALFTALNRDSWELHAEFVRFDAALAQAVSDKAVQVVQASEAEELLPRAASDPASVVCRGGKAGAEWHPPCAWQDRCWRRR